MKATSPRLSAALFAGIAWIGVAGIFFHLSASPALALSRQDLNPPQEELYKILSGEFTCQCGCLQPVGICPHAECGFGIPFKKELISLIVEGKTQNEIRDHFIGKYGLYILSAPPKSGFNLIAGWSLPFAAVATVGLVVTFFIRKWVVISASAAVNRKDSPVSRSASPGSASGKEKYRSLLQKELDEFEP